MDFSMEYTKEQEEFAKEVGAWLDENMPDDIEPVRDAQKMSYEQFHKRRDFARKLGEKGWLYAGYPREYGGGGLDGAHSVVISDELAKSMADGPPIAIGVAKMMIYQALETSLAVSSRLEFFGMDYSFNTEDREEGIRSFLEKRPPKFQGK